MVSFPSYIAIIIYSIQVWSSNYLGLLMYSETFNNRPFDNHLCAADNSQAPDSLHYINLIRYNKQNHWAKNSNAKQTTKQW